MSSSYASLTTTPEFLDLLSPSDPHHHQRMLQIPFLRKDSSFVARDFRHTISYLISTSLRPESVLRFRVRCSFRRRRGNCRSTRMTRLLSFLALLVSVVCAPSKRDVDPTLIPPFGWSAGVNPTGEIHSIRQRVVANHK